MSEGRREHPPVPPTKDGPGEPERSGPLRLERHRKADGRLLILYRAGAAGDDDRRLDPAESVDPITGGGL